MPELGLSLTKKKALHDRMSRLGINEDDILENFVRSQGPGGQNVNKVSTCVCLRHLPTGIEVKCQKERSQVLNRYHARKILLDKIESVILGKLSAQQQHIEKIRRQKRRRCRRAKLKILEAKRMHSRKKNLRAPIREIE